MLKGLSFDGYRAFAGDAHDAKLAHHVELAPLTVLIGRNNAGKTTVAALIQSVLRGLARAVPSVLPLQLEDRRLANRFSDLMNGGNWFGQIRFDAGFDDGGHLRAAIGLPEPGSDDVWVRDLPPGGVATPPTVHERSALSLLAGGAVCERARAIAAASVWLDTLRHRVSDEPDGYAAQHGPPIGPRGEGTLDLLLERRDLFERVVRELQVGPGVGLHWEKALDLHRLRVRRGSHSVPLSQVGDGVRHVLPFVTLAMLRAVELPSESVIDTVLQPELHLHDALHPWLGDLLLAATAHGSHRLVVETHSEGLLLRIRRRIVEGAASPERVSIYFVDDSPAGSTLRRIPLEANGDVGWWPDGVFLESLDELKAIRRAQRDRL